MTHWNYRVCKETYAKGTPNEEVSYTIREVYYDGEKITGATMKEVGAFGETVEELAEVLQKMSSALNKDVVDLDTLFPQLDSEIGAAFSTFWISLWNMAKDRISNYTSKPKQ